MLDLYISAKLEYGYNKAARLWKEEDQRRRQLCNQVGKREISCQEQH